MPFLSGKKKSGVTVTDTSRTTTSKVSQAGRSGKGLAKKARSHGSKH